MDEKCVSYIIYANSCSYNVFGFFFSSFYPFSSFHFFSSFCYGLMWSHWWNCRCYQKIEKINFAQVNWMVSLKLIKMVHKFNPYIESREVWILIGICGREAIDHCSRLVFDSWLINILLINMKDGYWKRRFWAIYIYGFSFVCRNSF